MVEKSNKRQKRGHLITEERVSTLLQRYSATTLLALLQEVAQVEGEDIDWNALVQRTSTGISNSREYQMIWRHLAYGHPLLDKFDSEAAPLDDDSDLECELEAYPRVTNEASAEAAACVKVLIASGLPSDSSRSNVSAVEAPLTINIPNVHSFRSTSENSQTTTTSGMNITIPVSIQKQQPQPPTEGLDANGSSVVVNGSKRKARGRRFWTPENDRLLEEAVGKCVEINWPLIRDMLQTDRTTAQLAQRWNSIKNRAKAQGANTSRSQLSEARMAARHALNVALDRPTKNTLMNSSGGTSLNSIHFKAPTTVAEASAVQHQSQEGTIASKSSDFGPLESKAAVRKISPKSDLKFDPVRAAAVAAGARIATQSDADSLLKAAHAKKAVHIIPTGGSTVRASMPVRTATHSEANTNPSFSSAGLNLATSPHPSSRAVSSQGPHSGLVKAASPGIAHPLPDCVTSLKATPEQSNGEPSPKKDAGAVAGIKVPGSEDVKRVEIQENGACTPAPEASKGAQEDNASYIDAEAESKPQVKVEERTEAPSELINAEKNLGNTGGNLATGPENLSDNKSISSPVKEGEDQHAVKENGANQSMSDKLAVVSSIPADKCNTSLEAVGNLASGSRTLEGEGSVN